jgi:predicted nucleic acid-binding protein
MKSGLKEKDSLHLSAAIESQCGCFITTDQDFRKYHTENIIICDPINFLKIWREKNA